MARNVTVSIAAIDVEGFRRRLEAARGALDATVQAALRAEARRIQRQVIAAFQRATLNAMRRELAR